MATKTRTMLLLTLLLASTAMTVPVVVAQSSTNNSAGNSSTSTPGSAIAPENETAVATVDKLTVVTDYWLDNGTMYIELYSNGGNKLTVTETTKKDGVTQVALVREWVPRGRYLLTVDLVDPADPEVLVTTRHSLNDGVATEISISTGDGSGSSVIPTGPYNGSDARDIGIGASSGVAFAHLLTAVRAKLGSSDKAERVA